MNRTQRIAATALSASALLIGAAPAAQAQPASSSWTCRQYFNKPYTYHGVGSNACDGYFGDGRIGGESDALDPQGRILRCTVQLNRVIGHHAYPMRGYRHTEAAYDHGKTCDALAFWAVPAGRYNVTTSYLIHGTWYTTVQGPVVDYPGN